MVNSQQNLKSQSCQKCKLQPFAFQKVPIREWLLPYQLGGFEYYFRFLKWFCSKFPRKLRRSFLHKLRFLKIRLLVTWLKFASTICEHWIMATPYPHLPPPPPSRFPGISRYSKGLVWIGKMFLGALQLDFFSEKTVRYERARWKRFQILINW